MLDYINACKHITLSTRHNLNLVKAALMMSLLKDETTTITEIVAFLVFIPLTKISLEIFYSLDILKLIFAIRR